MPSDHEKFIQALESHSYDALAINRYGPNCWLIITLQGEGHCFVNRDGQAVSYRHA